VRPPLWLDLRVESTSGASVNVTASLARCRNCGNVKATSSPCGFDHLAAVMEFKRDAGITDPEIDLTDGR
jgi:hypothetical protein